MENTPCTKHEEQIRTLYEKDKTVNKRVDSMESKISDMTDMKLAINTISISMEHIVEHNKRQDVLNGRQNATLENINQNLNELNEGQRRLNEGQVNLDNKVAQLEERVETSEGRQLIHTGQLTRDFILKFAIPAGIVGTVLIKLIEIING